MRNLVFILLALACGRIFGQAQLGTTLDWERAICVCRGISYLALDRKIRDEAGAELLLKGIVMRVELQTPGLQFTSTGRDKDYGQEMPDYSPPKGQPPVLIRTKRQTTPDYLVQSRKTHDQGGRALNMVVAFNSAPWVPWVIPHHHRYADPNGVNISEGVLISENSRAKAHFVIWCNGKVELRDTAPKPEQFQDIWLCSGGFDIILRDGVGTAVCGQNKSRHPRTALGLDARHRFLYILTVDGRQPKWSHGATYEDLNSLLLEAGAVEAINVDGGGSTTLCYWDSQRKSPVVLSHATTQLPLYRPTGFNIGIYFTAIQEALHETL